MKEVDADTDAYILAPRFMSVGKALQPDTHSQGFCHLQSSKNSTRINLEMGNKVSRKLFA